MSRSYLIGALLGWISLASFAVGGFAAFSPDTEIVTAQGTQSGELAGVAQGGHLDTSTISVAFSPPVEAWRPLVADHFTERDVNQALAVIYCESSGNPGATHTESSAAGLFQHLPQFWDERSRSAGRGGADIYDPESNVAVASWLVYEGGGWKHWYPSSSCWTSITDQS